MLDPLHELPEALPRILILKGLFVEYCQVLRQRELQHCVLFSAISELEFEEFLILLQDALREIECFYFLFLRVAVLPYLHTVDLEAMHFLIKFGKLRILERFQLRLVCLLLQLHQLRLHLEHVKSIRHQEVLLVLLKHFI